MLMSISNINNIISYLDDKLLFTAKSETNDLLRRIERNPWELNNELIPKLDELCDKISANYDKASSEEIISKIKKISENKLPISVEDRVTWYRKKISEGKVKGIDLVSNFDKLGLDEADLSGRLALCKEMATQCDWSALVDNFDKFGFLKDICERVDVKERLSLCKEIASQGEWAARALVENFGKLGLDEADVQERLSLCQEIVKQGEWAARALVNNFDKLGFLKDVSERVDVKDRLSLCQEIVSQGKWAAKGLVENFVELGLDKTDLSDRLSFCKEIASQGVWAARALVENFGKLGLGEVEVSGRLLLCQVIASQGEWATRDLVKNFDKLGLGEADLSDRLSFCKEIASQGEWAAGALVENFDKLGLGGADVKDRLLLCQVIASKGEWAAGALVKNFDKLGLGGADVKDRLLLCQVIASQSESAAGALVENFDELGFLKDIRECVHVKERLSLCQEIASQGVWAARALVKILGKLGLGEADVKDRLLLCQEIAIQGDLAAEALVKNFDKLGLGEADVKDRLLLCQEIAIQGDLAAEALVKNFDKFGFYQADVKVRLSLCQEIASQGKRAARALAENFEKLGLEEADASVRLSLCRKIASKNVEIVIILSSKISDLKLTKSEKSIILLEILTCKPYNFSYVRLDQFPYLQALLPILSGKDLSEEGFRTAMQALDAIKRKDKLKTLSDGIGQVSGLGEFLSLSKGLFNSFIQDENTFRTFLMPFIKKASNEKKQIVRQQLYQLAAYCAGAFCEDEDKLHSDEYSEVFQTIAEFRSPAARYSLIRELSLMKGDDLEKFQALLNIGDKNLKNCAVCSWILLSRIKMLGCSKEMVDSLIDQISRNQSFRGGSRINSLVGCLLQIIDEAPYTEEQMHAIGSKIQKIAAIKRSKLLENELNSFKNVISLFGKKKFLEGLRENKDGSVIFQDRFKDLFDVGQVDDLSKKYQKTFGSFRNPVTLFTYRGSVGKLPAREKEKVLETLNLYVRAVLEGKFPAARYDRELNPHLKKIFEGRDELERVWKSTKPEQMIAMTGDARPVKVNYKEIFAIKILFDKHLDNKQFPRLCAFLQNNEREVETPQTPEEHFEKLAIRLCKGDISMEAFLKEKANLNLSLGEFENDLQAILKQESISGKYLISESDEACDLIEIGTEIQGSCQRVNGDPKLNKCLVSYLMNGEGKPIVVKKDGCLVARSWLRLMWDDKKQIPVLLQERIYSNVRDSADKAINQWAVDKAKEMGVFLVSKEIGEGKHYEGKVSHLGGLAPYLYSDASGGVQEGPFEIVDCHVLYNPSAIQASL
jgi:hypothetical protein